jgi:hypothetical protein
MSSQDIKTVNSSETSKNLKNNSPFGCCFQFRKIKTKIKSPISCCVKSENGTKIVITNIGNQNQTHIE